MSLDQILKKAANPPQSTETETRLTQAPLEEEDPLKIKPHFEEFDDDYKKVVAFCEEMKLGTIQSHIVSCTIGLVSPDKSVNNMELQEIQRCLNFLREVK